MNSRTFCGRSISEVGLGTWQLGGTEWGNVTDEQAFAVLNSAVEAGVTFLDTADIYGLGRSETLIGKFLQQRNDRDRFFVATKLGRSPNPGWPTNFTAQTVEQHTDGSLKRLGVDCLDLTQTHCIPLEEMTKGEVFPTLARLVEKGKIRAFGASVESMDEALACLNVPGLSSLQIIFNVFRQKPIDVLFEKAKAQGVGIIVRLPLASGLLSGKMVRGQQFPQNDHRNFNRDGNSFNVGETFAGLPFEKGLELVDDLRPHVPTGWSMIDFALRWCLDFDAVSTLIPGATKPENASANCRCSSLPPLPVDLHQKLRTWYASKVAPSIRGPY